MREFIKIDNHIINVNSISKAKFISNDVDLSEFPLDNNGEFIIDYLTFKFGEITLLSGEVIELNIDLYHPQWNETNEEWYSVKRSYIDMSWDRLVESLGKVVQVTGLEYKYSK